jgi:acyl-CoA thioester hydrolase
MEKIVLDLPVHSFNIDYNGHVNNAVYSQWMEICVTQFFETIGLPLLLLKRQGIAPVLAETRIAYKQPIYYGETVRLEMWLSKLSGIYCLMEFRFFKRDGVLAATGQQKGVFVNLETTRPARLKADQQQQFARFLQVDPVQPLNESYASATVSSSII